MRKLLTTLGIITVLLASLAWTPLASADVYSSYGSLAAKQAIGRDYKITSYDGPSSTAVIAIHGGGIEIGTSKIAKAVAKITGSDLYTFKGIKKSNNGILHITSTRFNEPTARKLVAKSLKTLSIHGCSSSSNITYVGGRDKTLAAKVKSELKKSGFKVGLPKQSLSGSNPANICNRNANGKGVQLELNYGLRKALINDPDLHDKYVNALARALK